MLTEIGILYLRINDTKGAFDKLFEVTKSDENCSKALLALGSILQVRFPIYTQHFDEHSLDTFGVFIRV